VDEWNNIGGDYDTGTNVLAWEQEDSRRERDIYATREGRHDTRGIKEKHRETTRIMGEVLGLAGETTMKIHSIWDAPMFTDRYTICLGEPDTVNQGEILGMSENPTHPQGFCQHGWAEFGGHLGKRIGLADLPIECQRVLEDYGYHI
jgi:hypothetical protein